MIFLPCLRVIFNYTIFCLGITLWVSYYLYTVLHIFHPLDSRVLFLAFISARGVIVDIRTMTVEPDPAHPATVYSSRRPARYALEVPAGELAAAGVKVGDLVELLGSARDAAKAAR